MKTILTRGGIEFLAVFLGIALSLWVDDYREERELKERLNDDLIKIYNEVQANTANIEKIIDLNEKNLSHEEKLLKIILADSQISKYIDSKNIKKKINILWK